MLILDLPPSVEQAIISNAAAHDLSVSQYILEHLPKGNTQKQWQWLDELRKIPKDDSLEQAILEGRHLLRSDKRNWDIFK